MHCASGISILARSFIPNIGTNHPQMKERIIVFTRLCHICFLGGDYCGLSTTNGTATWKFCNIHGNQNQILCTRNCNTIATSYAVEGSHDPKIVIFHGQNWTSNVRIFDHIYAHSQNFDIEWPGMGHDNIHIPNCGLWFMVGYTWVCPGMIGSFIFQHNVWLTD